MPRRGRYILLERRSKVLAQGQMIMGDLIAKVRRVRNRQQLDWLWRSASFGLLSGGIAACILALLQRLQPSLFPWTWVLYSSLIGLGVGALVAFIRFRSLQGAASDIDRSCELKDRVVTALDFQRRELSGQSLSPAQQLQVADAEAHARWIDPVRVAPVTAPY